MPVRAEHRGMLPRRARAVERAGDEEARHRLEIDFLDREILALDPPVDHGVQRRARGLGPKAEGDAELHAQFIGALRPGRARLRRSKGKVAVEILERAEPLIVERRWSLRAQWRSEEEERGE